MIPTRDTFVSVTVDGCPAGRVALGQFFDVNGDAIDSMERLAIVAALSGGLAYHGGGGAMVEWSVWVKGKRRHDRR